MSVSTQSQFAQPGASSAPSVTSELSSELGQGVVETQGEGVLGHSIPPSSTLSPCGIDARLVALSIAKESSSQSVAVFSHISPPVETADGSCSTPVGESRGGTGSSGGSRVFYGSQKRPYYPSRCGYSSSSRRTMGRELQRERARQLEMAGTGTATPGRCGPGGSSSLPPPHPAGSGRDSSVMEVEETLGSGAGPLPASSRSSGGVDSHFHLYAWHLPWGYPLLLPSPYAAGSIGPLKCQPPLL